MDDKMADSEMIGDAQAGAAEVGFQAGKDKLKGYVIGIRDWLKNLAEDRTQPMDVKVHDALWAEIQSIDYDIEVDFKE